MVIMLEQELSKELDFTKEGRTENIRRIAEVSKLFIDAGIITLNSFITPLQSNRDMIRSIVGNDSYFEIFVNTPLSICEMRDVKGLYAKARSGEIKNFTGINSSIRTSK